MILDRLRRERGVSFEHRRNLFMLPEGIVARAGGVDIGMLVAGDGGFGAFEDGEQAVVATDRYQRSMPIGVAPDAFLRCGGRGQAMVDPPQPRDQPWLDL